MESNQIALVRSTWAKMVPIAGKAADIFYTRLFEIDPSLRSLFKGNMTAQGKLLMDMINTAVEGLDDLESIVPTVQDLGRRHGGYAVKPENYKTVASALLWTSASTRMGSSTSANWPTVSCAIRPRSSRYSSG